MYAQLIVLQIQLQEGVSQCAQINLFYMLIMTLKAA
jgi:hypothetical protein